MTYRTRGQGICVSKNFFPSLWKIREENTRKGSMPNRGPGAEDCSQTKQGEEKGQKHEYPY